MRILSSIFGSGAQGIKCNKSSAQTNNSVPRLNRVKRRLRFETLENRSLLAQTTVFSDTFETGISSTRWPSDVAPYNGLSHPTTVTSTGCSSRCASIETSAESARVGFSTSKLDMTAYRSATVQYSVRAAVVLPFLHPDKAFTVQYRDASGTWRSLKTETASALNKSSLVTRSISLPTAALHGSFILGVFGDVYYNNASDGAEVGFLLNDVKIVGTSNERPVINSVSNSGPIDEGQSTRVTVSAFDPDNDALTYEFDFDNNGSYEVLNFDATAIHTFNDNGNFQVNVRVSDDIGGVRIGSTTVEVRNVVPTISLVTQNSPINPGTPLLLSINATDPAGVDDPLTYQFDLDGDLVYEISGAANTISQTLFDSGAYTVNFAVRDDDGGIATGTIPITILAITPPVFDPTSPPLVWFKESYRSIPESVGEILLSVNISRAFDEEVVVPIAFSGTALKSTDYTASESITIPAGQLSGSTKVVVVDDSIAEGNETILVRMLSPTNAAIAGHAAYPANQMVTILQSDTLSASFSAANIRASESDSEIILKVQLSGPASSKVTIPLRFSGTAIPGQDFTIPPTFVEIPAGNSQFLFKLLPINDTIGEVQKELIVSMGTPQIVVDANTTVPGILGSTAANTIIFNDDDTPTVRFAQPEQRVWENAGFAFLTVVLSNASTEDVVVPLKAQSSIAILGTDYVLDQSAITIPAGSLTGQTKMIIIDDDKNEKQGQTPGFQNLESVDIELEEPINATIASTYKQTLVEKRHHFVILCFSDGSCGAADTDEYTITYEREVVGNTTSVVIMDDDPLIFLGNTDFNKSVWEGGHYTFNVGIEWPIDREVVVPLLSSGIASSDDYFLSTRRVTIAPNSGGSALVTLTVVDDTIEERNESLSIRMGASQPPLPVDSKKAQWSTQIVASDTQIEFSTSQLNVLENAGAFVFTIVRSQNTGGATVTIFELQSNSDIAQMQFSDGEMEKSFLVQGIVDDDVRTVWPKLILGIRGVSNGKIGSRDRLEVTILDDERPVSTLYHPTTYKPAIISGTLSIDFSTTDPILLPVPTFDLPAIQQGESPTIQSGVIALSIASGSQLASGMVFLDLNKNEVKDRDEPQAITSLDGSFAMFIPITLDPDRDGIFRPQDAQLVMAGGLDPATGRANGILRAPLGSLVVSPLTTIMASLSDLSVLQGQELSLFELGLRVSEALNLPLVDLSRFDPTAQHAIGNFQGRVVGLAQAKVSDTVKQIATMISGIAGAPTSSALEGLVYRDLASKILEPASILDLDRPQVVETVIRGALVSVGLDLSDSVIEAAGQVISLGNRHLSGASEASTIEQLKHYSKFKKLTQEIVAKDLLDMVAGQISTTDLLNKYTEVTVDGLAEAMQVVNPIAPELRISDAKVESGIDDTFAEFTVSLNWPTDLPVSVDFSTGDLLAKSSDGDYESLIGTLVWNPGDAPEKTIRIKVVGDNIVEGEESFSIIIRNSVNAVLRDDIGIATIVDATWHNSLNPFDVDADLTVTPLDVLSVINYINTNGSGKLPSAPVGNRTYYDVDSDAFVTPLDVLSIINFINANSNGESAGEGTDIGNEVYSSKIAGIVPYDIDDSIDDRSELLRKRSPVNPKRR